MLQVLTQYNGRRKIVLIYEAWDLDEEEVVDIADCTKDDIGKLARFTDGSGWHTRILNCSDMAVKTEAGTFRREDVVQCSRVKWPGGNYSGVPAGDEHKLVRNYTKREKAFATRIINNTLNGKNTTKRMKMLAIEKLREKADKYGVDEDYIVSRLVEMADNTKGKHAFQALITLSRMKGVELNQQTEKNDRPIGLFQQNNITIQEGRRRQGLPSTGEIRNMIPQNVRDAVVLDDDDDSTTSKPPGTV